MTCESNITIGDDEEFHERYFGSLVATGCDRHPPEIPGLGMGVPRVPDPTMWTIRNQVNLSFQARRLETQGYQPSAGVLVGSGSIKGRCNYHYTFNYSPLLCRGHS